MKFKLSRPESSLHARITLPASKSISNRLLIIHALSDNPDQIQNLSPSDDTKVMIDAFKGDSLIKDIGHAGTSMRFLTAYYSTRKGTVQLTGSDRMKERPIGPLVNALVDLGADIGYLGKPGFPPLEIRGGELPGGEITIDSGISSQFISALLMIAPRLKGGLVLHLKGAPVSASYIQMTLSLMKDHGAEYTWNGNTISIKPGNYRKGSYRVESDWSGASYWYCMALLEEEPEIRLCFLTDKSYQGDSVLVSLFRKLGVSTEFQGERIHLKKVAKPAGHFFEFDFTDAPDIVQSMAVALCLAGIPYRFTGTKTLRIKETDRIAALQAEMKKLGFILESDFEGSFLAWNQAICTPEACPVIETYHDHRMAMAFAPAVLKGRELIINDPLVVTKSYPGFWTDLKTGGFLIGEMD